MRALVQRVSKSSVTVADEIVNSIGKGINILVGICPDDTPKDIEYISRKILNLRVFEDSDGKGWSKSVKDMNYEILVISQFTLYAKLKGNKPDFRGAMIASQSKVLYEKLLLTLRDGYHEEKVKDGIFGAMMNVEIRNDGPITILLESPINK